MAGDSAYKLKPSGVRAPMDHRRMRWGFEHEVYYITVTTKTAEFANRLNLPSLDLSYIDDRDCTLKLHVGMNKVRFNVDYKFRKIYQKKQKRYLCLAHLDGGWKDVYEFMELNQGDTIEFRSCVCDPLRFYVARKMHDGFVEVKKEEFDGEFVLD
ncbi:hypothetical protein C2S53_019383 [Perilla frutescens var. hirtella]|uniref:Uncharacterized protein n=1 Tax=Perilla frutescens var. hirtella TaxID=608512 RepID=A0AAD4PE17_PERFH|nr:hypothetical protein C2S53_019383 [Perilla frutescens var. hirtella]